MAARLLALLLWFVACAVLAQQDYPFTVETRKESSGATIWGKNEGPAPVSVIVRFPSYENMRADAPIPAVSVVPPRATAKLVGIHQDNPRQAWRYQYNYSWHMGDYTASHAAGTRYRVPWMNGRTFVIGQAPGGPLTSHDTPWSRDAIDVNMPEGTPVLAARAGVVIRTVDEFREGRFDPALMNKANLVRVLHDDGTMADYLHLTYRGVAVKVGERVQAGRILGYSGSTGYSSAPHLHFGVVRAERTGTGFGEVSVPFAFYVGNPPYVFFPRTGMIVPAEYSSPGVAPQRGRVVQY